MVMKIEACLLTQALGGLVGFDAQVADLDLERSGVEGAVFVVQR